MNLSLALLDHITLIPIVLPLLTGGLLLLIDDSRRILKQVTSMLSLSLLIVAAFFLVYQTVYSWSNGTYAYLVGDWPAPYGITLVVDKLSATLVLLSCILGFCSVCYSLAKWDRAGVHFHPLFHFLLMGVNGAFLTGDLFNLFVFFEVFLAASYGLILHGSGVNRVSAGLQYIAINLIASFLLLISIALIYGVTGTLNMADLALKAGELSGRDRDLFEVAAAILGMAFLVKAGAWPFNFWLTRGYGFACAPVAAMFSIMTKVGIYSLLRISSLLLPTQAPAAFSTEWMYLFGLATCLFGAIGLIAAGQLEKSIGFTVIISAGTLLAALGMPGVTLTGPALLYLVSSVIATGTFFLLADIIARMQQQNQAGHIPLHNLLLDLEDPLHTEDTEADIGVAIPAAMAFLGLAFICCVLLVTGLPPLSGFLAKFSLLSAAVTVTNGIVPPMTSWVLVAIVLFSGFAGVISFSRLGILIFWTYASKTPRLHLLEATPVGIMILLSLVLLAFSNPISDYLSHAAFVLDNPQIYIDTVLSKKTTRYEGGGV